MNRAISLEWRAYRALSVHLHQADEFAEVGIVRKLQAVPVFSLNSGVHAKRGWTDLFTKVAVGMKNVDEVTSNVSTQ